MAEDNNVAAPKSSAGVVSRDLKPMPMNRGAVRPARATVPMGGLIPERSFGTRELGALIPRLTRPAFRKRSPESAQILADWPALAGPALAAMAEPVRLSNGTLTLACTGPSAMELGMMAPMLVERLNGQLGRAAIRKLAFVQRAPRLAAPATRRPPPGPVPAEAEAPLATLPEGELQTALARLARGVFARRPGGDAGFAGQPGPPAPDVGPQGGQPCPSPAARSPR